jgi:predicted nuclease of predicted toxin-antitoxin system
VRFLLDECFPRRVLLTLRGRGHDVVWAHEVCPSNDDDVVLSIANADRRIVMTEDRDFSVLLFRDNYPAVGVVTVKAGEFPGGVDEAIAAACARIDELGDALLGHMTRITPTRTRQKALKAIIP